jgi:hypothetical protein
MKELTRRCEKLLRRYPAYRKGQAFFNACYELYPDIADKFRATDKDPFYNDGNIDAFLEAVEEVLNNER